MHELIRCIAFAGCQNDREETEWSMECYVLLENNGAIHKVIKPIATRLFTQTVYLTYLLIFLKVNLSHVMLSNHGSV